MTALEAMGERARDAARAVGRLSGADRNRALAAMSTALLEQTPDILAANRRDVEKAKQGGMTPALVDRLRLDENRVRGMAQGIRDTLALTDPVGEVMEGRRLENGLQLRKIRVPMGVIGIIYEARPNVTSDAAALCLKAGSAAILRGGKEAFESNAAVTRALRHGLETAGVTAAAVQLVEDTSRETAAQMMRLNRCIDLLIPRGGAGLIRTVVENATVPVIQTGVGNCHVYIDESADPQMASAIAVNAKVSRPSVCNAAETLLIHSGAAPRLLPSIAAALREKGVRLRCCGRAASLLPGVDIEPADETDWETEYLDYILAVRVVDSLEEAVEHIARYGTGHSECIVTESYANAERFTAEVDAAAVYVNASTRFTDGGMFGLGAEIGISTQKLHARGPMGLRELTTVKYIVNGSGQVR
ncbi:MAG: glutamate-5-semialdehyde dehydrogenase [Clostridiales bacterium]|nr:glutamate-5-semialdehyde dehydrogenase [Clostridiales bacterium]